MYTAPKSAVDGNEKEGICDHFRTILIKQIDHLLPRDTFVVTGLTVGFLFTVQRRKPMCIYFKHCTIFGVLIMHLICFQLMRKWTKASRVTLTWRISENSERMWTTFWVLVRMSDESTFRSKSVIFAWNVRSGFATEDETLGLKEKYHVEQWIFTSHFHLSYGL